MCVFIQTASLLTKQRFRVGVGSSCKMKPKMRDEALNAVKVAIMLCFSSLVCLLY